MKSDIYQEVTDQIVAALEAGTRPWVQDWQGGGQMIAPRRVTGEDYSGINVILLWMRAVSQGYQAPQWMTFKQAQKLGGMVRKGEKGCGVVFASTFEKEAEGADDPRRIPFLKRYTVFNVEQIDGLPDAYQFTPPAPIDTGARHIASVKAFFDATGARVKHEGKGPFYAPSQDVIHMPAIEHFATPEGYYSTLAHEVIHWTCPKDRADRPHDYHKTEGRAFEELVAELGACFLAAKVGFSADTDNSAAYVASWLRALKSDKRFIFKAATQAQKAADYCLGVADHDAAALAA